MTDYAHRLELYKKAVSSLPETEIKGKSMPYTSANGHMFSFISKQGEVCLRLSKNYQQEFVDKYQTKPVVQYGSVMKEYVEIPIDLLMDISTLSTYFKKSYEYVSGLKPKAVSKK